MGDRTRLDLSGQLCWLRRDLRLHDHRPLHLATTSEGPTWVVFVFDTKILASLPRADRRVSHIVESLIVIDLELRRRGSQLLVMQGDPRECIPQLAHALGVKRVFAGEDYEPYAKARDQHVRNALMQQGQTLETVIDHVVFRGADINNQSGQPYRVFTPYKNAWLNKLSDSPAVIDEVRPQLERIAPLPRDLPMWAKIPLECGALGFQNIESGVGRAADLLQVFKEKLSQYHDARDRVDWTGTSSLSPHFRFGTLSIREAVRFALERPGRGSDVWISELVWREFYQMILDRFPEVESQEFNPAYRGMKWPGKREHFEAWCEGRTGFPIVDAAMRHFNATGQMHNRLRMIAASFLVKDLWIDWREGERYFAQRLLDFDLAANNGGWQWCASTGADPQPYFRVFNPTLQAERFDPEGVFIKRMLPERRNLRTIKEVIQPINPIVDHATQSRGAPKLYKKS